MKKIATILAASALLALVAGSAFAAPSALRISQVYGGGGNTGAPYNQDFIEIFNSSGTSVNIGGWAVEYMSASGSWGTSFTTAGPVTNWNYVQFPAGTTIAPCSYILVGCGPVGAVGVGLPTVDFSMPTNLSATNGNVGLFSTPNGVTACGAETGLVDKIAFGTGWCPETTAIAALSNTTSGQRKLGGLTDSDNNLADVVSGSPVPRNSASPINSGCVVTPARQGTWGQLKSIYR